MTRNLKYEYTCTVCNEKKRSSAPNQKLCSNKCRNKYYGRVSAQSNISSGTVGAISELEVCNDLLRNGYAVFRSVSPSCFCDIIAIKDNEIRKIEIRTGYKGLGNPDKIQFPRTLHTSGGVPNEYAVFVQSHDFVHYEPVSEDDITKYTRH